MSDLKLKGSVGNMMDNDEEDVFGIKKALYNLGFRKNPPQNGIIEQETDSAIREFQKAKGLKVDGYLMPGGETERTLKEASRNNVFDDNYINTIYRTYSGHADSARKFGLKDTARNLDHYLKGTGDTLIIPYDKIKSKTFIADAEKTNHERIAKSFLEPGSTINKKISSLKDGEFIELDDSWVYAVEGMPGKHTFRNFDIKRSHLLRGDLDEFLATGASQIKSSGLYKVKKRNGKIYIYGDIDHNWYDKYDFEVGGSMGDGARTLEKFGKAKPYDINANWKTKFQSIIDQSNPDKDSFFYFYNGN